MKKGNKRSLVILTIIIFVLLFDLFVFKKLDKYSICAFIFLLIGLSYYLIGFRKVKSRYDKDIILTIFIYVFIYYIIIYLSGLFIGFTRNIYSLNFISIIKNILPVLIFITLVEILRYILNTQIKDNKWLLVLSSIVFTLIDTVLIIKVTDFGNFYKAFWRNNYYQFYWICVKSDVFSIGTKWDLWSFKRFEIEVIGNIFDNPDLLESEE